MNWKKQRYPRKTYNARSELTSARRTKNGQPIPGFSEDFDYDPIGNRRSSATYNEKGEAQTSTYLANNLNQYTSRTSPGYAAVRGEADPNAMVTVNENPTFRLGSYYFGSDLFDNTTAGGLANLETYATLAQTAANGEETEDLVSATTNQVYLAQSPETFAYDADGNQTLITTKTGLWRVTYNGENRPILWVRDSDNATLTMSYDHMGRRRTKNNQQFFYDGYLQVVDSCSNAYIWDCTEPVVTRPLAWFRDNSFGYYAHDGNKNVSEVMATDGIIAAHYEYAPFGAVTTQRGTLAADNPWRFSSEFADDDTATVYYNYRHYESSLGRWQAKDPTKNDEISDLNLYVYCANSGILNTDELGLKIHFDESSTPQDITKKHKNRGYTIHTPISLQLKCSFWGRLTVNGIATRKIFLKPENDPIWAKRYKRYDVWGSPRTNAEERNCTLKHEMDHYQSYNDLFSFLHTIDALDGTNQGFLCCKKKKEELEIKYRYLVDHVKRIEIAIVCKIEHDF